MTEHIPDGVTEIIGDSLVDFKEVQFTPDEFNLPSYEMRREDVRDILIKHGIRNEQIDIFGNGENFLAVNTPDDTKHPANRRVEIKRSN